MRAVAASIVAGIAGAVVAAGLAVWLLTGDRPVALIMVSLAWAAGAVWWVVELGRDNVPGWYALAASIAVGAVGGMLLSAWFGVIL